MKEGRNGKSSSENEKWNKEFKEEFLGNILSPHNHLIVKCIHYLSDVREKAVKDETRHI